MDGRLNALLPAAIVLLGTACNGDPILDDGGAPPDHARPGPGEPDLAAPAGELGAGDCFDGRQDGDETDVDCGGSCKHCDDGRKCAADDDCASGACVMGTCRAIGCDDGGKNGDETGVDCGGPTCKNRCPIGEGCKLNTDCATLVCRAGACIAPPVTVTSFGAPVEYTFDVKSLNISQPAIADFNGDGKLDIAVVDGIGDTMSVFNGRGDGTLAVPAVYPAGHMPTGVVAWDFNGDKLPDLAILDELAISVLLANPNGGFNARMETRIFNAQPNTLVGGDFDHDGFGDLVFSTFGSGRTVVTLFKGDGKGQFKPMDIVSPNYTVNHLAAGDVDGDGRLDLAFFTGVSRVLLQGANLAFAEAWKGPQALGLGWVIFGDFDGDGRRDLVENTDAGLIAYLGNGKGTFMPSVNLGKSYWPGAAVVADFNVDGWEDLLVTSKQAMAVVVHPGSGVGVFNAPVKVPVGAVRDDGLAAGDLNRDGKPDIVCFVLVQGVGRLSVTLNTSH